MAYVGNQPARGQWRKLSDISSTFDGVITTFTTSVPPGTSQYFVTAGSASQLLISLGGVIQEPDVDYTVSTNSVTFTTPPTSGLSFFGVLCGDALNAGVPSDGSVTTSKLAGGLSVGLTGGSVSTPSLFFTGDDNTGVFSAGADQLNIATNGVERVEFGTSEVVFNDGGANYDFRVEGDTEANLLFVDAGSDEVSFRDDVKIDSSGRLLVGTSTNQIIGVGSGGAQFQSVGSNPFAVARFSNDTFGCVLAIGKSRGSSPGSFTTVQNNDILGELRFAGSDGTDLSTVGAQINAEVDGTPGANDLPTRLVFSVTADGASSPTERMRITNRGYLKATSSGSYTYNTGLTHEFVNSDSTAEPVLRCSHTSASAPFGIYMNYTGSSPNGTSNPFYYAADSTTTRFAVNSNGGIANYQANDTNLSDRNAKKDITLAADTWNCLKEWEIVNYRYKDQPDDADLNLGVIAQQVAESCPEVITIFQEAKEATEDAPAQEERLGVKEQQMYWMAIKALQEAQARIEALEAKVAALESA